MSQTWVTPPTFTPGENPRAADLNKFRDDLLFLYDPPRCAVRITSNKSVSSQSDTAIVWDQAVTDSTGSMWTPGSPTRVVARRHGIYVFQLSNLWNDGAASGGIKRAAYLHVNGSRRRDFYSIPPSSPTAMSAVVETNLNSGDYVEVFVRQDSGDPLNLVAQRTVLMARWAASPPPFGQGE